jgi:hypothetical protein
MKNIMQQALGDDWHQLPPALQAHYASAGTDTGRMDIEFPRLMQPYFTLLRWLGALIDRRGAQVSTVVRKNTEGGRQFWRRAITYADGQRIAFDSYWIYAGDDRLIEFVNPVLGLEMAVHVEGGRLHYRGRRFVLRLGPARLPIPEWLALGHTTIVERALSETRFAMDFRVRHPWFGQVFRYAGEFESRAEAD